MGVKTNSFPAQDEEEEKCLDVVDKSNKNGLKNGKNTSDSVVSNETGEKVKESLQKFDLLSKKWMKAISSTSINAEELDVPINKQLSYLNSAIKSCLLNFNNFESIRFFSFLFNKHGNEEYFFDRVYIMVLRWYFCLKYNYLVWEFHYLASITTLNSLIWGIKISPISFSNFLFTLSEIHFSASDILLPLFGYKNEINAPIPCYFYDENFLHLFKLFSNFQPLVKSEKFCEEFVLYVFDLNFSLCRDDLINNFQDSNSVLDKLWDKIENFDLNSLCSCYINFYFILLDLYNLILLDKRGEDSLNCVDKVINLYSKLFARVNSGRNGYKDVEANKVSVKREILSDSPDVCVNYRDHAIFSFSKFVKYCSDDGRFLSNDLLELISSFIKYQNSKSYDICKDILILGRKYSLEPLIFTLLKYEVGRDILSKSHFKPNCFLFNNIDMLTGINSEDGVSFYCYKIYESISRACGLDLQVSKPMIYTSTTLNSNISPSFTLYQISQNIALEFLTVISQVLEKRKTSICNLPIFSDNVHSKLRFSLNAVELLKKNSPITCSLISFSSLMCDDVYLDSSTNNAIRVLLNFKTVYSSFESVFQLLIKLFYSEIANDSVLSMEYCNFELTLYRTVLVRYLLQLLLSPLKTNFKIKFAFNRTVDFTLFVTRFFKFMNFRTNYILMDRVVFEKYLTTRVIIQHPTLQDGYDDEFELLNVHGFLEYCNSHSNNTVNSDKTTHNVKNSDSIKSGNNSRFKFKGDDSVDFSVKFDLDYLFRILLKFIMLLRNLVLQGTTFASELIDPLLFKYYLRLCSNNFFNHTNKSIIYSSIKRVIDTKVHGERVTNEYFAQFFGSKDSTNEFMESLGLLENEGKNSSDWKDIHIIDIIKLNNRYNKTQFYQITHILCQEFFKLIPHSCISTLLCDWSSSLPIDPTSIVKAEKISAARFVLYTIVTRLCCLKIDFSKKTFVSIEPLISAINVIFINLEMIFKSFKPYTDPELISDDEFTLCENSADLGDLNNYQNFINNYQSMRAERLKRLSEKRRQVSLRYNCQVKLLLEITCLISQILYNISVKFYNILTSECDGFVTNKGDEIILSCIGKKRSLYYSTLDFLSLCNNTIATSIKTCILSTIHINNKFDPIYKVNTNKAEDHSFFIDKIKAYKDGIKSKFDLLSQFNIHSSQPDQLSQLTQLDSTDELGGYDDLDDLSSFIDFETDNHLSMLTCNNAKRVNSKVTNAKKLKMTSLRNEWKCIIKSHSKF